MEYVKIGAIEQIKPELRRYNMKYDKIIIGAGFYGLYAALRCAGKKQRVLVLEKEADAFMRATYVNQARIHMGYHYPRSYSTAIKSAHYFDRFVKDYDFCLLTEFDQVYATSSTYSWTNASQFQRFCDAAHIRCEGIEPGRYFRKGMCDGAFLTKEYTYDAHILRDYLLEKIRENPLIELRFLSPVIAIEAEGEMYRVFSGAGEDQAPFVLNASYASTNQINQMLGFEPFAIKYELCEIILCEVEQPLKPVGLTVMDGPFFSIMPFGKTGYHSLTSVSFTPHITSQSALGSFDCQKDCVGGFCTSRQFGNCNECSRQPQSAWAYMSNLAKKYLRPEFGFQYVKSLYSIKPILMASEIDDSRPTLIRVFSRNPTFVSVLSGKINTVFDLDEVLEDE